MQLNRTSLARGSLLLLLSQCSLFSALVEALEVFVDTVELFEAFEVFSVLASVAFATFEAFSDWDDASFITLLALAKDLDFSALAGEAFSAFALGAFPALADTFSALASMLWIKSEQVT